MHFGELQKNLWKMTPPDPPYHIYFLQIIFESFPKPYQYFEEDTELLLSSKFFSLK